LFVSASWRQDIKQIVTYSKSQETINNILEAARTLFVEKNYANVTIVDIAAQADVSTGALYHHFPSKEDVYLQMMLRYLQEIKTSMQAAIAEDIRSCREQLNQSILAFLRLPHELQRILRLVRRDINIFADPMRREIIRAFQTAIPELVEEILRDGMAHGELRTCDVRLLSWELVAMVEVTLSPYAHSIIGGPEETADYVLGLLFDGIEVRQAQENGGFR
jgi:AcrR family transcriptional regulator